MKLFLYLIDCLLWNIYTPRCFHDFLPSFKRLIFCHITHSTKWYVGARTNCFETLRMEIMCIKITCIVEIHSYTHFVQSASFTKGWRNDLFAYQKTLITFDWIILISHIFHTFPAQKDEIYLIFYEISVFMCMERLHWTWVYIHNGLNDLRRHLILDV